MKACQLTRIKIQQKIKNKGLIPLPIKSIAILHENERHGNNLNQKNFFVFVVAVLYVCDFSELKFAKRY